MADQSDPQRGWQIFAIGSAVFAAVTTLLVKRGVAEVNSNMATFIRTLVILFLTAAIVSVRREWEPLGKLTGWATQLLVLSGITTGLSWLCYYRALQLAPASKVAPIDKLSVALVIVFAVLFLGESLTLRSAIGGILVVVGVVVLATP